MSRPYIELSYFQVLMAALLIVINGAISILLKLELERRLLIAAVCTVVQLLLIGVVLEWVFRMDRWYIVVVMMSVMTLVAGVTASQRTAFRFPSIFIRSVVATWLSSWLMASLALFMIVRVRPWYTPQYAIPLLGMILGNTLNGVSLGLDRLGSELLGKRDQIDGLLTLGATALGGRQAACETGGQDGSDPDHQCHDGGGDRQPTRHDDRTAPGGHQPRRGGQVPDRDHVLDRIGNRPGDGVRRPVELSPAVHRRPSIRRDSAPAKVSPGTSDS